VKKATYWQVVAINLLLLQVSMNLK